MQVYSPKYAPFAFRIFFLVGWWGSVHFFCAHCTLAKIDFTLTHWFIESLTETYSHGTVCSGEFLQSLNLVSNKAVLWLCAQVTIIHHFPVIKLTMLAVTSSLTRNHLFMIYLSVAVLLMSKEMKIQETIFWICCSTVCKISSLCVSKIKNNFLYITLCLTLRTEITVYIKLLYCTVCFLPTTKDNSLVWHTPYDTQVYYIIQYNHTSCDQPDNLCLILHPFRLISDTVPLSTGFSCTKKKVVYTH